jgi:excinuclease UvrABC ATPase subunit
MPRKEYQSMEFSEKEATTQQTCSWFEYNPNVFYFREYRQACQVNTGTSCNMISEKPIIIFRQ